MLKLMLVLLMVVVLLILVKPGALIGIAAGAVELLFFKLAWWQTALIVIAAVSITQFVCYRIKKKK